MTLQEYDAWFLGFSQNLCAPPAPAQWRVLQARVGEIDGQPARFRLAPRSPRTMDDLDAALMDAMTGDLIGNAHLLALCQRGFKESRDAIGCA